MTYLCFYNTYPHSLKRPLALFFLITLARNSTWQTITKIFSSSSYDRPHLPVNRMWAKKMCHNTPWLLNHSYSFFFSLSPNKTEAKVAAPSAHPDHSWMTPRITHPLIILSFLCFSWVKKIYIDIPGVCFRRWHSLAFRSFSAVVDSNSYFKNHTEVIFFYFYFINKFYQE